MLQDATQPAPPNKPYQGEAHVALLDKLGYVPDDQEGYGSVSQTEEDCLAYAALAGVSEALGRKADARLLRRRALFYRNLFDSDTKFLRPRLSDGSWYAPFDPAGEHGYVEGTGWHYRWLAAQDAAGLIALMGGDGAFNAELDKFFAYPKPQWTGKFYNPYNETDLQAPFLYDYSGQPWKTEARVRELLADAYGTAAERHPRQRRLRDHVRLVRAFRPGPVPGRPHPAHAGDVQPAVPPRRRPPVRALYGPADRD